MTFSYPPRFGLRLISPAIEEPISLGEAMEHLNLPLDIRYRDAWINRNITAARQWCEGYLGRSLAPQTLELSFGGQSMPTSIPAQWDPALLSPFTDSESIINLPMGPVISVTYVKYLDADSGLQTFNGYELDQWSTPNSIYLASGQAWPSVLGGRNAIQIRYLAGYTHPDDSPSLYPLPEALRSMILLVLGDLFANREDTAVLLGGSSMQSIPIGAQALGEPYKLRLGMA